MLVFARMQQWARRYRRLAPWDWLDPGECLGLDVPSVGIASGAVSLAGPYFHPELWIFPEAGDFRACSFPCAHHRASNAIGASFAPQSECTPFALDAGHAVRAPTVEDLKLISGVGEAVFALLGKHGQALRDDLEPEVRFEHCDPELGKVVLVAPHPTIEWPIRLDLGGDSSGAYDEDEDEAAEAEMLAFLRDAKPRDP